MNFRNDLVDALPYIDGGYDEPGVREAVSSIWFNSIVVLIWLLWLPKVLSMIEEETKRYKPTKNYLDYLGTASFDSFVVSPFLKRKSIKPTR